jgi:hypothetical protein
MGSIRVARLAGRFYAASAAVASRSTTTCSAEIWSRRKAVLVNHPTRSVAALDPSAAPSRRCWTAWLGLENREFVP